MRLIPRSSRRKLRTGAVERKVETRPETFALLGKGRGLVRAFFSEEASKIFDQALGTPISIETVPKEFEKARNAAILKLAQELGLK